MIGDYFEKYNDMICKDFCRFRGEPCENGWDCELNKRAKELQKEYARMILESEEGAKDEV